MILSGSFRALSASLLACWATAAVVSAQQTSTLGEVARKEEERRKKVSAPAKVYTNRDLPKPSGTARPPAGTPATPSATPKPAEQTKPEEQPKPAEPKPAAPPGEEKNEDWWRKRITAVRDELQRTEMAAVAFQSRVNALTAEFSARDDPYQRAQISIERQKVLDELERVKADIVGLKQAIADIEQEARVAGVPPGWLR
jgi:hypothetical protein